MGGDKRERRNNRGVRGGPTDGHSRVKKIEENRTTRIIEEQMGD